MKKLEKKLVIILTAIMYGFCIFIIAGIFFWFYPREVVKSATEMMTDRDSYIVGQPITVKGKTWTNVDSPATFDVRLICDEIKYQYAVIERLNVSKQTRRVTYSFRYPEIPDYIPSGRCYIETTANYTVQVLPLLYREYQYIFTSNQFTIRSER